MAHDLSPSRFRLEAIDGWVAGDSRILAFRVTLADGTGKDITEDDLRWSLLERAYDDRDQAVLSDDDPGVEIRTDPYTDPTDGAFEVRVNDDATAEQWGRLTQRVTVDPPDDSRQTWVGRVVLDGA